MHHAKQLYDSNTQELDEGQKNEVTPESVTVRVDENDYILRQIMTLPFSESQAILFRYYDDMKIEDIANLMGISRSSVKRYLKSGQEKLSKLIKR